jgi:hypothetical protein
MKKSDIHPMPMFFDRYIHQVTENDLMEALLNSQKAIDTINIEKLKSIGNKTYQEGKWTINDIFQHIIDNERIQSYRALRFARKDTTVLPGYDEGLFADNTNAKNRKLEDIIEELRVLRISTIQLYKSMNEESVLNSGICFSQNISPLALGFVIVGHQQHHLNVIKEKYETLS